ncbi:MAG: hypothetical protein M1819_001067 [Sarea resinae]|nr:MAG: hypothetical protein M1819_001067 [Sarea resinae]
MADESESRTLLEDYLADPSDQRLAGLIVPFYSRSHFTSAPRRLTPSTTSSSLQISGYSHTLYSSTDSQVVPVLTRESSTASTDSIDTAFADDIPGYPLLQEQAGGVLEYHQPPTSTILECPFRFLGCIDTFASFDDWHTHSLEHFGAHGPPAHNICCFCDFTFDADDGKRSWEARMHHVADVHHRRGESLARARPDFALYRYLEEKGLMSAIQLRRLADRSEAPGHPPLALGGSPNDTSSDPQELVPVIEDRQERRRRERQRQRRRRRES